MKELQRRLARLEGPRNLPVAIVLLPRGMSEDDRAEAVTMLCSDLPEHETMTLTETTSEEPALMFFGDLDALLAEVAASKNRIGISGRAEPKLTIKDKDQTK